MSRSNVQVNEIFESLCRALSVNSEVNETSHEFSALNSNLERVDFATKLLNKYGLGPRFVENKKSELVSAKYREEGNKEIKDGNFHLAWMFYTKSIAFAPHNTEALGLAYANRSVVLLRKDFYEQCLRDIERAMSNKYPANLRDKLELRKAKCKKPPRSQAQIKYYDPPPSLQFPSQYITCATSALEIREKKHMGRHVVTNRDLSVGDVLAIEEPYSKVLLKDCIYSHCTNCLEVCYDLISCPKCIYALFCSEKCQESAWKSYHQYECPIITTLYNLELTKLNLLALRIALQTKDVLGRIHKLKKSNKVYKSGTYEELHFLETNTHLRNSADLFPRSVTAAIIYMLLKNHTNLINHLKYRETDEKILKELILRHLQTGPTNFHEISECREDFIGNFESSVEIGAGAYSFLSLLNHSCNPNVLRVCHGTKVVLRALRPIKKGEQLFDNYGYHYAVNNKMDRQRELKKQYFFSCRCEACEQSWSQFKNLPMRIKNFSISDDTFVALMHGDLETAVTYLPTAIVKAQKTDHLRPCKTLATIQETIKKCFSLIGNRWERL